MPSTYSLSLSYYQEVMLASPRGEVVKNYSELLFSSSHFPLASILILFPPG